MISYFKVGSFGRFCAINVEIDFDDVDVDINDGDGHVARVIKQVRWIQSGADPRESRKGWAAKNPNRLFVLAPHI